MAFTKALSRPIVIMAPRRRGRIRRAGRRAVSFVRSRGRGAARRSLPTVAIALSAMVVGYAQQRGFLDKLPQIGGSKMMTLGIAGWAATRFTGNQHLRMAGLAALTAAAFDFGRVQGGGTSGLEEYAPGPGWGADQAAY